MCTEKTQHLNVEILAKAVGRRKEAVAQVQLVKGTGRFIINDKPAQIYLQNHSLSILALKAPFETLQNIGLVPSPNNLSLDENSPSSKISTLEVSKKEEEKTLTILDASAENIGKEADQTSDFALSGIDTFVKVQGGGLLGQAEAVKLGVARALCQIEVSSEGPGPVRHSLKAKGYLTSDSRCKERRKYGLKKARKASQYHKR